MFVVLLEIRATKDSKVAIREEKKLVGRYSRSLVYQISAQKPEGDLIKSICVEPWTV